jgi:ABC-type glycerol-3-phosphate transport system substrate-binding protein
MKTVALLAIAMIASAVLSGCGSSGSNPAATADNPTPPTVTGLSTPKSVSVVTAN